MVKKMNKKKYIEVLKEKTKLSEDKCIIINDILESHFIVGRKNKQKIIDDLKEKLNIDEINAEEIYNVCMEIILSSVKEKLKSPFKSND